MHSIQPNLAKYNRINLIVACHSFTCYVLELTASTASQPTYNTSTSMAYLIIYYIAHVQISTVV